jgi:isoaspartyl peptidase/L-asparaginase-like protein (Ntn-hydrolase superfamily)
MNRKTFLIRILGAVSSTLLFPKRVAATNVFQRQTSLKPLVISTWPHGMPANEAAWKVLNEGGRALDAVEQGVMVAELDPEVTSVGYGGYPDRDGDVTLDASIMDEKGNCGSVAFLQHIKTPIAVARLVMEKTPHVMLAGEGALQFAMESGMEKADLLTDHSRQKWEEWKKSSVYTPVDVHNHDTISMLAIDKKGDISGACTTSGLAFKMKGRVGDSPVIGAGLYVDNEVGGAGATGVGEVVLKTLGSFAIVELMRHGYTPQEACEEQVRRILKKVPDAKNQPVHFIAVNKQGAVGAFGSNSEFSYALYTGEKGNVLHRVTGAL